MFAQLLFRRVMKEGNFTLRDSFGRVERHGDGLGPAVTVKVTSLVTEWRILTNPKLAIGEAYMEGKLVVEEGTLYDFLDVCVRNVENLRLHGYWALLEKVRDFYRYVASFNPIGKAQQNVAHHYDLSDRLYDLFLCDDRQYSCAYYDHPEQTLEEAQTNKKRHLAAKLRLDEADLSVLDIGSGWGGLGLYIADLAPEAKVRGVTLSKEQLSVSNARAHSKGLGDRVRFELKDYRLLEEQFDRIVSVGMFEHVGPAHFLEFFSKVKSLLSDKGIGVIHSIGTFDSPGNTNPWITKYIFPGGYIPSLSETLAAIERAGLYVTDIEILRDHYAETLLAWRKRFYANMDEIQSLYDARFCRMWDFYLTGCEVAFRSSSLMNFQIQVARNKYAAPLQRDYITDWERAAKRRERRPDGKQDNRRDKQVRAAE